MNLTPIKQNMTELELPKSDGGFVRVLFSYKTPVAAKVLGNCGMEYHVTNTYFSRTTSKHINSWMPKEGRIEHEQEWFDNLLAEVK